MKCRVVYLSESGIEDFEITTVNTEDKIHKVTVKQNAPIEDNKEFFIENPFLHPQFPMMLINMSMLSIKTHIDFARIKMVELDYPEKTHDYNQNGDLIEVKSEEEKRIQAELGGNTD